MTDTVPTALTPPAAVPARVQSPVLTVLRGALRLTRTKIGLVAVVVVVVIASLGPLLASTSPTKFVGIPFDGRSAGSPLGTDYLGRDVLARVLHGGRTVVWMSLVAATIGAVVGAAVGIAAAFHGGWLDEVLMRISDVVLSIPNVVLVLLFVTALGPRPWLLVLLIGIAHAPQVARVIRGSALGVVHQEFVQHARAIGVPRRSIFVGDIIPHVVMPLMVEYAMRVVWSINALAAMSVLGFGIQAPASDWGLMINENRNGITLQPLGVAAPMLGIMLFAFGTSLIADGVSRTVRRLGG